MSTSRCKLRTVILVLVSFAFGTLLLSYFMFSFTIHDPALFNPLQTDIYPALFHPLQTDIYAHLSQSNPVNFDIFYQDEYIKGYDHWIRGLSDTKLLNDIPGSNCLYPSVPNQLTDAQAFNFDFIYANTYSCHDNQFSWRHDRVILIWCYGLPQYFESSDITCGSSKSHAPKSNHPNWKTLTTKPIQSTLLVPLKLQPQTQVTWIKCKDEYNLHFSLVSLFELNDSLYITKRKQIQHNFNTVPPNIVLFVIDSTSRSNFMRGAPQSVDYLSELMRHETISDAPSPCKIIQYFRYSTVGHGTGANMFALNHGIAQYYDALGYYVPGYDPNTTDTKARNVHYLSHNVFAKTKVCPGKFDIELAVDYVLQLQKSMHNTHVPFVITAHTQTNHRSDAKFIWNMDRHIRHLLENINKQNTIIHLLADHGTYQTDNIYGRWETRNPLSIQLIPNILFEQRILNLTRLRINEQRLVSHLDMNRFYKEIAHKLSDTDTAVEYLNHSESIIDTEIAVDRPCHHSNCFCEVFEEIDPQQTNTEYLSLIIDNVNRLTGLGQLDCKILNKNDFKIISNMRSTVVKKQPIEIIDIQQTQRSLGVNDTEYEQLKKEFKILTFGAVIDTNQIGYTVKHKSNIPEITRKDYFKYEPCITTEYDFANYAPFHSYFARKLQSGDSKEPVFRNKTLTILMLKQLKEMWNLRLCSCKTRTLQY
eukprot:1047789_1